MIDLAYRVLSLMVMMLIMTFKNLNWVIKYVHSKLQFNLNLLSITRLATYVLIFEF